MILLPTHACSGDDGREPASEPYGELDAQNVATCTLRVRWGIHRGQDERLPGCGARIAACFGCGLRTRVLPPNGTEPPPCPACGATVKPDVVAPAPTDRELVDPSRSIVQTREARDDAPSVDGKPAKRAPARRGKKGAVVQEAPGLPLFGK
jgi:hypothetical protein